MDRFMKYKEAILATLNKLGRSLSEKNIAELEESVGINRSINRDYERWSLDQVFMSIAFITAKASHDSNTQHGAVIVDEKNHIVSTGFNGFLPGSFDEYMPNDREGGHKYPHMMHAEHNALDQSTRADLEGCRVYVTGVPCNVCFRRLISRGIKEVIIGDVGHVYEEGFWETHHWLAVSHGVRVRHFHGIIANAEETRTIGPHDGSAEEANRNRPHGLQEG